MARLLLLGLALILSACAQKKIILDSSNMVPLKQLESSMTKLKGDLSILSFADHRTKKDTVGIAVTGVNNIETPIYLDISPEEYVKRRFVIGLTKRGIDVTSASKYGLKGNIKKLWVWEHVEGGPAQNSECEVEIEFDIISTETKAVKYHGNFSVNALGTNNIIDTTDSDGPVLESCMSMLIEKFVQDSKIQKFLGFEVLK